jgi:hypothetical protein
MADYRRAADTIAPGEVGPARRAQLRAGLALVDGATSALRAIARADLDAGRIVLASPEALLLHGEAADLVDDGAPRLRPASFSAHRLVKFSFLVGAKSFGVSFGLAVDEPGWRDLGVAMGLRHRLTHAAKTADLEISDADWAIATRGISWFTEQLERFIAAATGS